jgi:hypothetical protein
MTEDVTKSESNNTASTMEGRNRRRSERVVLRVPLQLSARMPDGKRISIAVYSLVVNAHGGLLDVGTDMLRGQQVILSNPRNEQVASGKIVRAEGSGEGRFEVAFEFEFAAPSFWPVSFPPADWSLAEAAV